MKGLKILGFLAPLAFMCAMQTAPGARVGIVPLPTAVAVHNAKLVGDGEACRVLCLGQPDRTESDWPQLRVYDASMSSGDADQPVLLGRLFPGCGTQWLFDFAAAQSGPNSMLVVQYLWSSGVGARVLGLESGARISDEETRLTIPGHNERSHWSAPMALDVFHTDLWPVDKNLWLSLSKYDRGEVSVTRCEWGRWDQWVESKVVGRGSYPSLCGDTEHGLFLSLTDAQPTPNYYLREVGAVTATGALLLVHSADGTDWSEPTAVPDENQATSSAVAFDASHGLVLVYSARRDEGWPLFARRSDDSGRTWGEPVMLTEPTAVTMRPDALFCGDRLCVAFLEERDQTRIVCTMVLGPDDLPSTAQE